MVDKEVEGGRGEETLGDPPLTYTLGEEKEREEKFLNAYEAIHECIL